MNALLSVIVADDAPAVRARLQAEPGLATALVQKEQLFARGIFHWLYAGDTALHLAAAGHRPEIVCLLLRAGADPNAARNRRRSSPLHYAADGFITGPAWSERRQVATIAELLTAGADLHRPDANGATPLHRAVRTRCAGAVETLLRAGADPAAENNAGSTPFHLAVQNTGRGGSGEPAAVEAQRRIIELFLALGMNGEFQNRRGQRVLDVARSAWIRDRLKGSSGYGSRGATRR